MGVAGSPVIGRPRAGAFSTLLRRPGLRASSDGVLATKTERKMLASTCLYSLYAWFHLLSDQYYAAANKKIPPAAVFYACIWAEKLRYSTALGRRKPELCDRYVQLLICFIQEDDRT